MGFLSLRSQGDTIAYKHLYYSDYLKRSAVYLCSLRSLLILMAPFAPAISQELWGRLAAVPAIYKYELLAPESDLLGFHSIGKYLEAESDTSLHRYQRMTGGGHCDETGGDGGNRNGCYAVPEKGKKAGTQRN